MNSWQQILAAYPLLQTIWDALTVLAPMATLLAYAGIFFISATAKIIAIAKKRSAFNKCARQLALLGLIMGWILLVTSRIWLYYHQGDHTPDSIEHFIREISWLLFSIGVLLSSIYYSLWGVLKNMPVLHATLGMIGAVQNCVAFVVILFAIRVGSAIASPDTANLALPDFFPSSWDDTLWSAACYALPLLLAMPAAIGACWLVLRRKKEDYGRDYYNAMVPWVTAWARNAWLLLWCMLVFSTGLKLWPEIHSGVFNAGDAILDNARILIWLLPPVLWTIFKCSKFPLRQSWLLFVAMLMAGLFMIPWYLELTLI